MIGRFMARLCVSVLVLGGTWAGTARAHDMEEEHLHEMEDEPHGGAPEPVVLNMHTDLDGNQYELSVERHDAEVTPVWSGRGAPPLAIDQAIERAVGWLQKAHPEFSDLNPESVTLMRLYHRTLTDRWAYTMVINARGKLGPVTVEHQFSVAVLLNGNVVEAKPVGRDEEGTTREEQP